MHGPFPVAKPCRVPRLVSDRAAGGKEAIPGWVIFGAGGRMRAIDDGRPKGAELIFKQRARRIHRSQQKGHVREACCHKGI